jgi:hypothetical protein
MHSACDLDLHVTVNYIKMTSVAQQCLYEKFMSPATVKCPMLELINLAKQMVMTDSVVAQFLSFCTSVKHFTRSDEINQL